MAIELGPPPLRDLLLTRPNEIGRQWQIWFSDIRNALATFNNEFIGHNHDERYYTKTESDSKYSLLGHVHTSGEITDFNGAVISIGDGRYSLLGHVHTSGEITDFNSAVISIGDGRYSLLGHRHSILYDSVLENVGLSFDASADGTFSQNVNISVDKLLSFGDSSISFDESEAELVIKTIGMSDDIRIATHAQTGSIILEPGSSYGFTIIKNLTEFPSSSYSGIMVHSNGYQFYRTKTQLLSDIGASVSGHRHYQLYDSDLDELALSFDADKDGTFTGSALFATSESIGFAGTMAIPYASIGYVTDTELLIQSTQTGRDVHIKAGNTGSIVLEPGAYNAVDGIIFGGTSYATNIRNIWSTSSNSGVIDWVTADDEFLFHDNIKLAGTEHFYSASDSARQMIFSTAPDRGSTVGQIIWNMSGGTTEIARIDAGRTAEATDDPDSFIDFYSSRSTATPNFSRDMRLYRGHLGIGRARMASGTPTAPLHVVLGFNATDTTYTGTSVVSVFQNDGTDGAECDVVFAGGKTGAVDLYFYGTGANAQNIGRYRYDHQNTTTELYTYNILATKWKYSGANSYIEMNWPVRLSSLSDADYTVTKVLTVNGDGNIESRSAALLAADIVGSIDHGSIAGLADDDHTQYLLAAGTRALTADWDAGGYEIRALTFESDVATGTAPLTIASTTVVPNLNSDTVDGINAAAMTSGRLVRYNSTGTTIETGTVAESSGALSGITTVGMSGQLTSTVATGTAPFVIASTTVVSNLNSDLLDGQHGSYYAPAAHDQAWSTITDTPTTLAGYGITDAAPAAHGVTTGYLPYANAATTWANSPLSVSGTDLVRGTVFKMTNTGMLIVGDNTVDMGPPNNLLSVQVTASPSLPHTGALRCGSWLDDGQCGQFSISKALGTKNSPAAVTDGKLLGIFSFAGYAATRFRVGAYLGCYAEGTFTDSSAPARLSFNTAPSGSSSAVERFRIKSTGDCSIPADSKKLLFGAADDASILYDGTNMVFNSREVGTGHFVFSGGNVGIGATAPASLTEIQGGLTTTGAVLTLGTKEPTVVANDILGRINFYAPLEVDGSDAILPGASIVAIAEGTFSATSNATSLRFQTGSSEAATVKMTLTSAGYMGVGTTGPAEKVVFYEPTSGACFLQIGNETTTVADNKGLYIGIDANAKARIATRSDIDLIFETNYTNRAAILANGDFGIGTTGPQSRLNVVDPEDCLVHLVGDSGGVGSTTRVGFYLLLDGLFGTGTQFGKFVYDQGLDRVVLGYGNDNDVVITTNGYVGIGTTAPDKQVEINSATGACLRLTHNDSNGSATYYTDFSVSDAGNLTIAPSGGAVFMADDVALTMGNSAADPDVIIEHDTTANPDEFIIENTVTSENVRIKAAASGSIILEASGGGGGDGNVNIKFGSSGVCNIGETAIAYVQFDYAGNTYWDGGYPHLPVKSDTGDPAGVEGRIYINTHDNKIRCYADGAWRDLATW